MWSTASLDARVSHSPEIYYTIPSSVQSDDGQIHLQGVALDFCGCSDIFEDVLAYGDWEAFSQYLLSLPAIHKVIFGFRTREHMQRFKLVIAESRMARMYTARVKLVYALLGCDAYPFEDRTFALPKSDRGQGSFRSR